MRTDARGNVYETTELATEEQVACFASLFVSRREELFSVFQIGEIKNSSQSNLRLCHSRDGGETWRAIPGRFRTTFAGEAGSLSNGELVELRDGRLMLISTWINRQEPTRPFYDPATEGILHTRILKSFSSDHGFTWSPWEEIPLFTQGWSYHTSGPILKSHDGTIMVIVESHKSFDAFGPSTAAEGTWCLISTDDGTSFQGPHLVAQHPEHRLMYWDARLTQGNEPGTWLAMYWTHDQPGQRDLSVHLQLGRVSPSGITCGPVLDTGIPGQISAPLCLDSNRWLAVAVRRDHPGTITVWQTLDAGIRWKCEMTIHSQECGSLVQDRTDLAVAEIWENIRKWSFGHPAIRQLDRTHVLVTWYAGTSAKMGVQWARIRLDE